MKSFAGIIILAILIPRISDSQSRSSAFPGLNRLEVDSTYKVWVYFDSRKSALVKHPYKTEVSYGMDVLLMTLAPSLLDTFLIRYDSGPSADPGFLVFRIQKDSLIQLTYSIFGLALVIPGDGFIYVDGHTNTMFNTRRKFLVSRDTVKEISQPFYYVGLDSKTSEELHIYSDFSQTNEVAIIPRGSPTHVLLNQGRYYLLRTQFGLVGWVKLPVTGAGKTPIEGLYYVGD